MDLDGFVLEIVRLELKPGEVLLIKLPGSDKWQVKAAQDWFESLPALAHLAHRIQVVPGNIQLVALSESEV